LQGCSLWRGNNIKVNICGARVGTTEILGLAIMEIKVNIF